MDGHHEIGWIASDGFTHFCHTCGEYCVPADDPRGDAPSSCRCCRDPASVPFPAGADVLRRHRQMIRVPADDETLHTREQWMECGGGPAALLESLEAWAGEIYGGPPWPFGDTLGDLLDELAARGYRVTAIEAPSFVGLMPPTE